MPEKVDAGLASTSWPQVNGATGISDWLARAFLLLQHGAMKLHALVVVSLLFLGSTPAPAQSLRLEETAGAITISRGSTPVLVYHKAEDPAPEGQNPAFKRSGFIHPLCAPSGAVVTGIRPPDHLHHMGLWHAWVKCEHGGRHVDFWNLKEKTGTVRYAKTLKTDKKADGPAFTVEQEHVELSAPGGPQCALRERLAVRARFVDGGNVIDYTMTQKNVSREALVLPAYRYGGGIGYRARIEWDNSNSDYLTSEGKTRADSHQSRARWCAMFGPTEKGDATVVILGHPSNHDAPQRLRTWGAKDNNGRVFSNFVPVQEKAWEIKPGAEITLRYQVVVLDGKPERAAVEARWKAFAGKNP